MAKQEHGTVTRINGTGSIRVKNHLKMKKLLLGNAFSILRMAQAFHEHRNPGDSAVRDEIDKCERFIVDNDYNSITASPWFDDKELPDEKHEAFYICQGIHIVYQIAERNTNFSWQLRYMKYLIEMMSRYFNDRYFDKQQSVYDYVEL